MKQTEEVNRIFQDTVLADGIFAAAIFSDDKREYYKKYALNYPLQVADQFRNSDNKDVAMINAAILAHDYLQWARTMISKYINWQHFFVTIVELPDGQLIWESYDNFYG